MKSPKKRAHRNDVTPWAIAGGRRCIGRDPNGGALRPEPDSVRPNQVRASGDRAGPKKFTEPVALSSTSPVNLRLPPTALGSGFDLLALRARCKREDRPSDTSRQGPAKRNWRILRAGNCPHFHGFSDGLGRTLWITELTSDNST